MVSKINLAQGRTATEARTARVSYKAQARNEKSKKADKSSLSNIKIPDSLSDTDTPRIYHLPLIIVGTGDHELIPRGSDCRHPNQPDGMNLAKPRQILRDYQKNAVDQIELAPVNEVLDANGNVRTALVIAPTGAGKTTIFSTDIVKNTFNKNKEDKILVLTHRRTLSQQIAQRILDVTPPADRKKTLERMEIIQGGPSLRSVNIGDRIFLASTDTLTANKSSLSSLPLEKITKIVIDEAHHYTAKTYWNLIEKLVKEIKPTADKPLTIIGATATPNRHMPGVVPMTDLFPRKSVVKTTTLRSLIERGFLKRPKGIRIQTNLGARLSIDEKTRDFKKEDMEGLSRDPEFNQSIVRYYKELFKDQKKDKALVFAFDGKHVKELCRVFNEAGIKTKYVLGTESGTVHADGTVQKETRQEVLNSYKEDCDVIINCDVLTEGVDLPETQGVIMATITRSIPKLSQICGRGMRINPLKPEEDEFTFMYLAADTSEKFRSAILPDIGLEDEEIYDSEDKSASVAGAETKTKTKTNDTKRNDKTNGTNIVGLVEEELVVETQTKWMKEHLYPAIRRAYPGLKDKEAFNECASDVAYIQDCSEILAKDVMRGDFVNINIIRAVLKHLGLDFELIQSKFPELVGFKDFKFAKARILEVQPERPSSVSRFFNSEISSMLSIGRIALETLAKKEGLGITPLEIANEIWGKKFADVKDFSSAQARILEVQPKKPSNLNKFFDSKMFSLTGIGFVELQALAKKEGHNIKKTDIAGAIWGLHTFEDAKKKILEFQPNKPKKVSNFFTYEMMPKLGIGVRTLAKFAENSNIGGKISEMACEIWGKEEELKFDDIKESIISQFPNRPVNVVFFFNDNLKQFADIGLKKLKQLAKEAGIGSKPSELANAIWVVNDKVPKSFDEAKSRILKIQPKRSSSSFSDFLIKHFDQLGFGLDDLKKLAKDEGYRATLKALVNQIWGELTFEDIKTNILEKVPLKPSNLTEILNKNCKDYAGVGAVHLKKLAKAAGLSTKTKNLADAIWGKESFQDLKSKISNAQPNRPINIASFFDKELFKVSGVGTFVLKKLAKEAGIGTKYSEIADAIWDNRAK